MTDFFTESSDGRAEHFPETRDADKIIGDQELNDIVGRELENMDVLRQEPYLGAHKVVYRNDKGEVILTLGPHWYMTVVGVLGLLFMGLFTVKNFWELISDFKKVSVLGMIVLELSLYLTTALLNPGIKSRRVPVFGRSRMSCSKCLTNLEDRVQHCADCDVCIEGLDHHCIWTGKCIGRGNYVAFILFVVCTPCYLLTIFLIVGDKY